MRTPRLPHFEVIYEDADVIVINKPAGLLTSTVPREKRPTAIAILRDRVAKQDRNARVGVIHRLDRDASGLLVFSRNHEAYRSLKEQFLHHTVKRVYAAIVQGVPNPREGTIKSRLVELPDGTVHSTRRSDHGEEAITHYKTIGVIDDRAHLRVMLETGKKHQIRVHLSERGNPILNDPLYASGRRDGELMLAAIELQFEHPNTHKRLRFEIPLPRVMAAVLRGQ